MSEAAEQVVRRFLAALKQSDVNELVSFFGADAVWTDGPRGTYRGADAIRAEIEAQVQLVPSITVEVRNLVASGGTVMVERADVFEIQGKSFDLEVVGVFEVDGNGRIVRLRDYYDLNSLMDRIAAAFASGT
ncbi:nuclear transport factor 2 family protein [Mycobacterium sp.]|uniref:nuclear transport factor 2 family protein n=1 Tax=Mycobacterium sp. TaxID=1785 RepID=UPI002B87A27B|nr:nuclear transport factor 2 family protein [Mycobacterium sp.]HTQ20239.1 nuclear transport factor 2 family protein [Mycobacterium sp.]